MPSLFVFYHFLHPDDVVSAQLFTDLCVELQQRGWNVRAIPSNRSLFDENAVYPPHEEYKGVSITRIWRPRFRQASTLGRLLNAAWMTAAWGFHDIDADVVLIGTDPILSVTAALLWRLRRSKAKVVHWCFDLYPEAAIADGLLAPSGAAARIAGRAARAAYKACDLIVDIGSCMRAKLHADCPDLRRMETLTPWALAEPARPLPIDVEERQALFGNDAKLTLMYSGNFGRAHSFDLILRLARRLRDRPIQFVFSVRGNREQELRAAVKTDDTNVSFAGFAPADRIEQRLSAADIQMVSLESNWTGIVVPSKFFGALAVGRPVLFAGDMGSSVAQWITSRGVGWVLTEDTLNQVSSQLSDLVDRPGWQAEMFERCHGIYLENFSKKSVCDRWDETLRRAM